MRERYAQRVLTFQISYIYGCNMTVFLLISSISHREIHLVLRKSWIDEGGLSVWPHNLPHFTTTDLYWWYYMNEMVNLEKLQTQINSTVHHGQCWYNMKQKLKQTESNKCHFTMCLLVPKYIYYILPMLNMTVQVHNSWDYNPGIIFFFLLQIRQITHL